jgi:peptide/nickel transport system ATP-binding protein
MSDALLQVAHLDVVYHNGRQRMAAVSEVTFEVLAGETFGLIGASGCGKSSVLRVIAGLERAWRGQLQLGSAQRNDGEAPDAPFAEQLQMVFQDPYGSLHPRHTVDRSLSEALRVHGHTDVDGRVREVLEQVGLDARYRFRYPHQLSGGQRQRVAIARALMRKPALLLLDEPTSALDASVQAEILNLLNTLKRQLGTTYLLVSHDLGVISHMCDRVAVMQQGRIVETLNGQDLLPGQCHHPYTAELLSNSLFI